MNADQATYDVTTVVARIQQAGIEIDRLLTWAKLTEKQRGDLVDCANHLQDAWRKVVPRP